MSTNIKLSEAQMSKIIQSGRSFGFWLGNLGRKALTNIVIPLARDNLPGLVSNLASNAINNYEIKISGKGAVRAGKWFYLFWMEDRNDIIKIIKIIRRFGCINWWSYWDSKTWNKKTRQISWSFVITVSCFNSAISDFLSSKRCKWNRN